MGPTRAAGAASPRRLGPLAARAGWGIADQALSSATNFALGVMVARSVAPSEFGLFALIFAAYVLLLGTSRSLSTDPLIVRFGASEWAQLRGRAVHALGTALGFGTICALVGALIILMLDVVLGMRFHSAPFYLLAASLPGLLLEDALRYVFFARRDPRSALLVDASAAVVLALAFLWIASSNARSLSWFVAAWGVSGLVSAAVGLSRARLWPGIGGVGHWLATQRDLSSRYLGEFIALSGSQFLVLYFLAFVTSLPEVAALRGGQMLMTPVMVLFAGVGPIAVPELILVRARSRPSFERYWRSIAVSLGAVGAVWGTLVFLLPSEAGESILGTTWSGARPLVPAFMVTMTATAIAVGPQIALRSLAAASASLRARVLNSALTLGGGVAGGAVAGAWGAAVGLAVGAVIASAVWWSAIRAVERTRGSEGLEETPSLRTNQTSGPHVEPG